MSRLARTRPVVRIERDQRGERPDTLVVEEPLEVRVGGRPLTVTMRTPGHDVDLAVGFLVTEGLITARDQFRSVRYCLGKVPSGEPGGPEVNTYNVLDVVLRPGVELPDVGLERNFFASSSCGLCGKASIDAIETAAAWEVAGDPLQVKASTLAALPDRLRDAQDLFRRTGAIHAAGLFDADGTLICAREDVGRHNAVDKVVGWAVREDRLPLRETVLLVSGRASFELTQKALMAGIPMLAAVSAPTSLAAELAEAAGQTLVGFLRGGAMNVYAGAHRVVHPSK